MTVEVATAMLADSMRVWTHGLDDYGILRQRS